MAKHQPAQLQQSWFFRRRSLPSLEAAVGATNNSQSQQTNGGWRWRITKKIFKGLRNLFYTFNGFFSIFGTILCLLFLKNFSILKTFFLEKLWDRISFKSLAYQSFSRFMSILLNLTSAVLVRLDLDKISRTISVIVIDVFRDILPISYDPHSPVFKYYKSFLTRSPLLGCFNN